MICEKIHFYTPDCHIITHLAENNNGKSKQFWKSKVRSRVHDVPLLRNPLSIGVCFIFKDTIFKCNYDSLQILAKNSIIFGCMQYRIRAVSFWNPLLSGGCVQFYRIYFKSARMKRLKRLYSLIVVWYAHHHLIFSPCDDSCPKSHTYGPFLISLVVFWPGSFWLQKFSCLGNTDSDHNNCYTKSNTYFETQQYFHEDSNIDLQ